jgi:hypothetical protein
MGMEESSTTAIGPAFFAKTSSGDDPAMCRFEAAIHTLTNKRTPSKNTPTRTPLGYHRRHHHQQQKAEPDNYKESLAFFCIDDRVYQVNLGKIESVEIKLPNTNEEHTTTTVTTTMMKPPCLIVQFDTCCFRIFSISNFFSENQFSVLNDQVSVLNAAKIRIEGLIMSDYRSQFPARFSDSTSPTGTSAGSSSEPGQKEYQEQQQQEEKNSQEHSEHSISEKEDDRSLERSVALTQKCQKSYNKSKESIEALQKLLEVHHPNAKKKAKPSTELRNTVSNLLASMANSMSSSFCTQSQLVESIQTHNQLITSCHNQVDDILKSVWPNLRPKKRARYGSSSTTKSEESEPRPPPPKQESIAHLKDIMKKHKQVITAKYTISLLPTRG